ncbi:MAG: CapA family protein [Lachnospiraceae bacterium]|nr:CapA family protein [Lachnospiraceae bacterium]
MRKRIKADSVDELFEIVKAVQNGEDPEEYAKRKREEARTAEQAAEEAAKQKREEARAAERAAEEAAKRKREEARAAERAARETAKRERLEARADEEKAAYEETDPEEDFEQLLEDDSEEEFVGLREALLRLNEYLNAAGSFLGWKRPLAGTRRQDESPMKKPLRGGAILEKGRAAKEVLAGWKENASQKLSQVQEQRKMQNQERRERAAKAEPPEAGEPETEVKPPVTEPKPSMTEPKPSAAGKRTQTAGNSVSETRAAGIEADLDRTHELGRVRLADIGKEPVGKTKRRYGAKSISEESETIGQRILHSLHMEPGNSDQKPTEEEKPAPASDEINADSIDLDTVQILDRLLAVPTQSTVKPKESVHNSANEAAVPGEGTANPTAAPGEGTANQTAAAAENTSGKAARSGAFAEDAASQASAFAEDAAGQASAFAESPAAQSGASADREAAPEVNSSAKNETEGDTKNDTESDTNGSAEGDTAQGESSSPEQTTLQSIQQSVKETLHTLRGSKMRTAGIITAVAAVFLIIVAAGTMLHRSSQLQEKQKYVTADEGLTITVENQPDEWCSTCELKMKISVKGGTISSIEADGTAVEADDNGYVTVSAQSTPLEMTVTTEDGTLTASVEIPMLDTDAPVVTADLYGGQIILTAADSRSGVEQIRYAVVEDDDWLQLPQYQDYTEAIPYEEDCIYYFYAVDQAGNCSVPVVSNMVTAESITLSESELTLYPGGTAQIDAEVNPSGALLTDLHYESSNTDVVTVSSAGAVTAVAEGSALIKVTADGVDMATCSVTVATEATVTISAIGDCTLGTYKGSVTSTSFDTYYSMYGADWFFQNVRDILANDDITFANLEGPLTDSTDAVEKTYAFKGDPSYTEILQDGSVEVVTLANNHSSDYGSQGFSDTKENLTAAGIEYCTGDTIAYQEVSGVKVACIGIYELAAGLDCEAQVRETIAEA